jgi:hypothetical protein
MRLTASKLLLVAAVLAVGCGGELPPEPQAATTSPAPPAPAPPGDGSTPTVQPKVAGEQADEDEAQAAPMPDTPAAPAAGGSTEVAGVGVGAKGQNYGGPGLVTTPVEAYFRTEERIAFEIQIPHAMKLYKAEHNNKGPKSHEEFMKVIIEQGDVKLPELPEGAEFVYDPKTEQLLVRHPAP